MHPEGMNWSWPDLMATPVYVRRYCWDLLQIRRKAVDDELAARRRKKNTGGAHGA